MRWYQVISSFFVSTMMTTTSSLITPTLMTMGVFVGDEEDDICVDYPKP
jgi:hypothetical protein